MEKINGSAFAVFKFHLLMSNSNLNTDKEQLSVADKEFENTIRPGQISDFSGQSQIIENLKIFIKAAKIRGEALDHVLRSGY